MNETSKNDEGPAAAGERMFPAISGVTINGIGPAGDHGSIESNPPTIQALREGVTLQARVGAAVLTDAYGDEHKLPIAVVTKVVSGSVETRLEMVRELLDEADKRAGGPRRRMGTTTLADLESLIAYVNRYKHDDDAAAFVQADPATVTVILDYDAPSKDGSQGVTGWRGDRVVYSCPLSRQWQTWTEHDAGDDGDPFGQVAFGDWIEAHAEDIITKQGYADASTMLATARNLVIYDKGTIKRQVDPVTGTGTLQVSNEHDTKSTPIPPKFMIAIPVFEGAEDHYEIECRVRFALDRNLGIPSFSYTLHNRAKVYEMALEGMRKQLASETGIPVFVGAPPPAR